MSQRADLAVRALVLLQRSPTRLRSGELAAALGTTPGFVPQVMSPLIRAEWVRSQPGPTGGYEPIVDVDRLNVLQVVEMVDGPTESGQCVVTEQRCNERHPCALHVSWGRARNELVAALTELTLADVGAA